MDPFRPGGMTNKGSRLETTRSRDTGSPSCQANPVLLLTDAMSPLQSHDESIELREEAANVRGTPDMIVFEEIRDCISLFRHLESFHAV